MSRQLFSLRIWSSAGPRGVALFLGLFSLLNIVGDWCSPGFDANLWWINLPGRSRLADQLILGWAAIALLWFARHAELSRLNRILLTLTFGGLTLASLWNVSTYYGLSSNSQIRVESLIPFSAWVAGCLALVTSSVWWPGSITDGSSRVVRRCITGVTCLATAILFPLAQMLCFGTTDYRRPADVAVVFGAKVFADGRVSFALEERVRTGCELYHSGLVSHVLMSGGPGVGAVHETTAMRRRAIELGVPAAAVLTDTGGWDTELTTVNTIHVCRQRNWRKVLAVSQFYHLPRIKLAFHRHGSEVYTVPCMRLYRLYYLPYFMLREVAAWWVYYVRPLWQGSR